MKQLIRILTKCLPKTYQTLTGHIPVITFKIFSETFVKEIKSFHKRLQTQLLQFFKRKFQTLKVLSYSTFPKLNSISPGQKISINLHHNSSRGIQTARSLSLRLEKMMKRPATSIFLNIKCWRLAVLQLLYSKSV